MTNHDVEHAIKKRMSGDVRDAFVAIGQCCLCTGLRGQAAPPAGTAKAGGHQIPAGNLHAGPWRLHWGMGLGHLRGP